MRAALSNPQHQPNRSRRPGSLRIIQADTDEMPEQGSKLGEDAARNLATRLHELLGPASS